MIQGLEKLLMELTEYQGPVTPEMIEKEAQVSARLSEIEAHLRPIRSLVHSHLYPEEWHVGDGAQRHRWEGAMHTTHRSTASIVEAILWWLCLGGAPAVLFAIELFHPAGFTQAPGMWEYLSKPEPYAPEHKAIAYFGPEWWSTLHMIQTP